MKPELLLTALWSANSKDDHLKILSNVKHNIVTIGRRLNNSGVIEHCSNPFSAIIEGVTNGYDAVIMDWLNKGKFVDCDPVNVSDALDYINRNSAPLVHVYHQRQGEERGLGPLSNTVTIVDQGCGMTEEKMTNGPLDIGSAEKTLNRNQHGNYGHGGGSLYGQSESSLIITRLPHSNKYIFTLVFKEETDDENVIENYVYITDANGNLFVADAHELSFFIPGELGDVTANKSGSMILPLHGTVRRNFGMNVKFHGFQESTLYTTLIDGLFGSYGRVRLVGDETDDVYITTGRRHMLNVPVGHDLFENGGKILLKIPEKPVELFVNKKPFGIAKITVWAVDNWSQDDKILTPVNTMLDGKENGPPHGIFVTLNGQTHARHRSTMVMRYAGLNNLISNVIIEVNLDNFSRRARRVIVSDRTRLDDAFVVVLDREIVRFLKAHPELEELNKQRDCVTTKIVDKDLQTLINQLIDDKILGLLSGSDTDGTDGKSKDGDSSEETSDNTFEKRLFVPNDPPTFLTICKHSMKKNRTEWVTILTDAPDHYENKMNIILPYFMNVVEGTKFELHNGRLMFPATVSEDAKVGESAYMYATVDVPNGKLLEAKRLITIIAQKKPENEKLPDGKANYPKIEWQELDGYASENYASIFGNLPEKEPAFTYSYNKDKDIITIYVNRKFDANKRINDLFASTYGVNDGRIIYADFIGEMSLAYMTVTLMSYKRPVFDNYEDADKHRVLATTMFAFAVMKAKKYQNREIRNSIIARAKNDE